MEGEAMCMTKGEYADSQARFAAFLEREGIDRLTSGNPTCPHTGCGAEWDDDDQCPNGHGHRDVWDEAWFSWHPCEVCWRSLGGDRKPMAGADREGKVWVFAACIDCEYYAAYGRLDDATMAALEG